MKLTSEGGYRMTIRTHAICFVVWLFLGMILGWLFYDCIEAALFFVLFYPFFCHYVSAFLKRQLKKQMQIEFKDVMISIYSSLSAGATMDESFQRALKDMERSLKTGARMVLELDIVCRKMAGNVPIGQCLEEMAERCDDGDVENFIQILTIGKRQGNNLADLVKSGIEKIQRRIEISYEIEGMIGAKKQEFYFMCSIPAGIIGYMRLFSPDFMVVLYGNIPGILAMTVCLTVYGAAIGIGTRMLQINV